MGKVQAKTRTPSEAAKLSRERKRRQGSRRPFLKKTNTKTPQKKRSLHPFDHIPSRQSGGHQKQTRYPAMRAIYAIEYIWLMSASKMFRRGPESGQECGLRTTSGDLARFKCPIYANSFIWRGRLTLWLRSQQFAPIFTQKRRWNPPNLLLLESFSC